MESSSIFCLSSIFWSSQLFSLTVWSSILPSMLAFWCSGYNFIRCFLRAFINLERKKYSCLKRMFVTSHLFIYINNCKWSIIFSFFLLTYWGLYSRKAIVIAYEITRWRFLIGKLDIPLSLWRIPNTKSVILLYPTKQKITLVLQVNNTLQVIYTSIFISSFIWELTFTRSLIVEDGCYQIWIHLKRHWVSCP